MEFAVGAILEGKVTGITKFGAFVALPGGKSGLVHISNISDSYVSDINEFLTVGQEVKVKVIGIDESGRINLSIKKAMDPPPPPPRRGPGIAPRASAPRNAAPPAPATFEDKLKQFMQDSDNKISGIRQYSDRRGSKRRGK